MAEADSPGFTSTLPVKKKKSYDAAFKLNVVKYAAQHGNREAARRFGVGESSVRDWKKQQDKLSDLPSKKQRLPGGGRKPLDQEMEAWLKEWIEEQRSRHLRVTRSAIQKKATEIHGDGFVASRGWLERFLERNGFTLRRRTTGHPFSCTQGEYGYSTTIPWQP